MWGVYLHNDFLLQIERSANDGDGVVPEVSAVRGEGRVHSD